MKVFSIALILSAAFVEQTLAHYRFFKFINGGNVGGEYVDIRKNTNYNSPVTDPTSLDMRCNVGGQASAATTETLSVTAGSTIGFRADGAATHPGPFNIYMAKAPKTASQYDGSGAEWFRVWEKGATFSSGAITFDTSSIDHTFVLPKCLPNGDYLVRIEHIALHTASTYGGAQYYISCAQITVTNGGSTTPTNKVAIPGVYTGYEPSIMINIYYPVPTSYTVPGPPIFKC